jgi:hypothetical protein
VRHTIADALGWPALARWTLRDGHQLMRCVPVAPLQNPCAHLFDTTLAVMRSLHSEQAHGGGPNLSAAAAAAVDPSIMVSCEADAAAGAKDAPAAAVVAAPAAAPVPVTVNIPALPPPSPSPPSALASRHRGGGGSGGELTAGAGAVTPGALPRVSSAEARLGKRSPSPKQA